MTLTSRHFLWLVLFCLLLSISANVYQYRSMATDESHRIEEKNEKHVLPKTTVSDPPISINEQDQEQNSIISKNAERFITFAFTWEDGTYTTRKRQADQYMSKSIKRTLFASGGSDSKFTASVFDIEVFPNRDNTEHCLVRFQRTLTIDANGYEETSDELVELTFTHHDGHYIVNQMKSLQTSGGV
ncbi:hypothetical protein [Exiguobacterium sp. RIT341]|uniref:hypothetical protein n=1 Tax=Exiguobacterium sp. RIT341 TaxID=1470592 RepID=UPI00044A8E7C|nr:hypothetical protein [Exiguobacterium sp. RIT341]EZP58340.1 hypothetical protein BW42_03022 [Exiguobacterium sp. RIT341]